MLLTGTLVEDPRPNPKQRLSLMAGRASLESTKRFTERKVFTVKELTTVLKNLLEEAFPLVWVEGEIANLRFPASGHVYFTLREEGAPLRAVLFRTQRNWVPFDLEDGLHVLCLGHISVYEPRGEYQLVVQLIEPKGLGALQLALEQRKRKLAAEGLFDEARKRKLPLLPRVVGLVTSLSGAALRDFLKVALARFPKARVRICPVRVQGDGAAQEITQAIKVLGQDPAVEVIVITRGGGSLEDLWAFNEEVVVRAVYASPVPVVSAVGHEIDYTLCDLVADARAPTPTAAAQLVFPREEDLRAKIDLLQGRLQEVLLNKVQQARRRWQELSRRLRDPREALKDQAKRLQTLSKALQRAGQMTFWQKRQRLEALTRHLHAVSPLAILARGYSVVRKWPEGTIVCKASALRPHDEIEILLSQGRLQAVVKEVKT